jgi:hypothetical protein
MYRILLNSEEIMKLEGEKDEYFSERPVVLLVMKTPLKG